MLRLCFCGSRGAATAASLAARRRLLHLAPPPPPSWTSSAAAITLGFRSSSSSSSSDGGGDGSGCEGSAIAAAAAAASALAAAVFLWGGDGSGRDRRQLLATAAASSASNLGTHVTNDEAQSQRKRRRRVVVGAPVDRLDSGDGGKRTVAAAADAGDTRSLHKSALTRSATTALPLSVVPAAAAAAAVSADVEPAPAASAAAAEAAESAVKISERSGMPCSVPYLIIGSGFAGMAAARAIRASDPLSKVLMIGDEPYPPYLRPPLSKELWRRKEDRVKAMLSPLGDMRRNSWLFVEPDSFFIDPGRLHLADTGGVSLWRGRRAVALDVNEKSVTLDSGDKIHYGKCLLATGGRPRNLPLFEVAGAASPEVAARTVLFRGIGDFHSLSERAQRAKSVLVVGGGFLGCELAVSLSEVSKKTGLQVHQVFKEPGALAHVLPPYLSAHTASFIGKCGVTQYPGEQVTSVAWDPAAGCLAIGLSSGRTVSADLAVVAVGIGANTQLAETAGLEVDPAEGGFLVNAELEARADLYAAGDACSYYDILLGRRRVEHVNHAEESGAVAGKNMAAAAAGAGRVTYQHQSSFWCNLANTLAWDAVGLVDSRLQTQSFFAMPPEATSEVADYQYPGVVFYTRAGRVVGILLWNLPDEIFQDKKAFAPSRLNLARKILAERQLADPAALQALAREFDVYQTIDDDYQDLKKYMEAKEKEGTSGAEGSNKASTPAAPPATTSDTIPSPATLPV